MTAIRRRFGDDIAILTDANTGYSVADARRVMPAIDELGIGWLEEPFPAHEHRSYAMAKGFGRTPLAAGENHYTRFEFHRVIEDGDITILQPDLSKSGGITEVQRIAAAASMWKLPVHPHSSMTGLNHAVSIHFLASIDNGGYFEADLSVANKFRDELGSEPSQDRQGWLRAAPGKARNRRGSRREVPSGPSGDRGARLRMKGGTRHSAILWRTGWCDETHVRQEPSRLLILANGAQRRPQSMRVPYWPIFSVCA